MKTGIGLILVSLGLFQTGYCIIQPGDSLTWKSQRQARRLEKIEEGKPLISPLAGPAYTPELKFTIAGGILISYKTDRRDSLIQRSSSPIMFGVSATGAYFFSSKTSSFWLEDKIRIYMDVWYKNMPDHYWGVGYQSGFSKPKSDSTTAYQRLWWQINPVALWQVKQYLFIGVALDYNYTGVSTPSVGVTEDPYYQEYGPKNLNSGTGFTIRFDSRDIPVNAWSGLLIDLTSVFYIKAFGGENTYQVYQLDMRKYFPLKKNIAGKTLVIRFNTRIGIGDVPYAELSQLGSPFDLRGYIWGQYRDKSSIFLISEYRHMFKNSFAEPGKHGIVLWTGIGSIGDTPTGYQYWLPNIGFGYRFEVQPRMNLRIDIGFGRKTSGFYFNFNEAF